ncbi:unnamed protein product [Urochloa decumbens]|uniref:F-box domain-containing protein n=1 Tax=Urochloa decumbens TaxID=240449 RepID=A0ABC9G7C4_9POAL
MSLSKPCAAPAVAASVTGVLHPDAVYEILLRLPAKELCRLRAVCRPWRSLLSDLQFIVAHSARHPEPLIVAGYDTGYRGDGVLFDIINLSGQVVKRVRSTAPTGGRGNERVASIQSRLVCITDETGLSCRLLDPATGSVCAFAKQFPEEVSPCYSHRYNALVAFGQVGPAGVYKALRIVDHSFIWPPVYEVCTLDGSSHAPWREKQTPTYGFRLSFLHSVVINGKVYFLTDLQVHNEQDQIAYFDLETEKWSPSIMGPLSSVANNGDDDGLPNNHIDCLNLSLAELNGCLVVVCRTVSSSLDLWFLKDFEKDLWVKKYSFQVNLSAHLSEFYLHPLLVLNDGRIVTYLGNRGSLRIYDPSTSNYTEVLMNKCVSVGLYTGSLLSLANSAK